MGSVLSVFSGPATSEPGQAKVQLDAACYNAPHSMDLQGIFFNKVGRLRSGWRLVLYLFILIALSFLIATGLRIAYAIGHMFVPTFSQTAYPSGLIYRVGELAVALGAGYFCVRVFEGL